MSKLPHAKRNTSNVFQYRTEILNSCGSPIGLHYFCAQMVYLLLCHQRCPFHQFTFNHSLHCTQLLLPRCMFLINITYMGNIYLWFYGILISRWEPWYTFIGLDFEQMINHRYYVFYLPTCIEFYLNVVLIRYRFWDSVSSKVTTSRIILSKMTVSRFWTSKW